MISQFGPLSRSTPPFFAPRPQQSNLSSERSPLASSSLAHRLPSHRAVPREDKQRCMQWELRFPAQAITRDRGPLSFIARRMGRIFHRGTFRRRIRFGQRPKRLRIVMIARDVFSNSMLRYAELRKHLMLLLRWRKRRI